MIVPDVEAPPAGMGIIMEGGEGVEIIVPDHDMEVKAKDSHSSSKKLGMNIADPSVLHPSWLRSGVSSRSRTRTAWAA